jgi:hypothetical protein
MRIKFINSHDSIDFHGILILLIFFSKNLNFIKVESNPLNLRLESYLDKPVGASPLLVPGYPLYGIGSGIGGSPRASLWTSHSSSLRVSSGIRLRGSLTGSIRVRVEGSTGDGLRSRPGSSLMDSLGDSLRGRLGWRFLIRGHLVIINFSIDFKSSDSIFSK